MTLATKPSVSRKPRARIALGITAVLCAVILFGLWGIGVFGGNVHTVVPHQVYRSAQLTGHNLDSVLANDHIRTVINLRGGTDKDSWYRSELAECQKYGAQHVDVPMSGRVLPSPAQLEGLFHAFDTEPYPVLFHCKAGSDRSGLTGTIYMNVYQHVPLDQAEGSQLTWRYGHFAWGQTHAMNDFFDLYRKTNHGQSLRDWITTQYPKLYSALPASSRE